MRVIVTRPAGQAEPLATRLLERGYEVVLCPLIRVEPIGDEPIDVTPYEWVIVTSANGAAELARRMRGTPRRVAAIGSGTAAELARHGIGVELTPRVSTQEGLLAALPPPTGRVLFAGAEAARPLLAERLGAETVALYRTVRLRPSPLPDGDLAVLASASAAQAFGEAGFALPVVTIGPQTTAAAQRAGARVVAEAARHDLEGLVDAVDAAARRLGE